MADDTRLPPLDGGTFITDGGMETTLIFRQGMELPEFASFVLLDDPAGVEALRAYFRPYLDLARDRGVGILLDTPTWRANAHWGRRLGYTPERLDGVNRRAVALLEELRAEADGRPPLVISGCIGPRGDGYVVGEEMSPEDAETYHRPQIATFADTAADVVSALTMTYAGEAIGIVRAAAAARLPVVVSFTVETDGRLPSGQPLGDAIGAVDEATDGAAAYFMVNCAHPTHFEHVLDSEQPWVARIRGVRANASTKSHAELDASAELDAGDAQDLGQHYRTLRTRLPNLTVVGGCCGTDETHVREICDAVLAG